MNISEANAVSALFKWIMDPALPRPVDQLGLLAEKASKTLQVAISPPLPDLHFGRENLRNIDGVAWVIATSWPNGRGIRKDDARVLAAKLIEEGLINLPAASAKLDKALQIAQEHLRLIDPVTVTSHAANLGIELDGLQATRIAEDITSITLEKKQ